MKKLVAEGWVKIRKNKDNLNVMPSSNKFMSVGETALVLLDGQLTGSNKKRIHGIGRRIQLDFIRSEDGGRFFC